MSVIILLIVIAAVTFSIFLSKSRNPAFKHVMRGELGQVFVNHQCASLRRELLKRVHPNTAARLINLAKLKHPGKSECWYLDKVLYDLKRGR